MPQQTPYFPLGGGLDYITPAIAQKPGSAIGALNYEPVSNGYRRVEGFERFDGHTSPTDSDYWELDWTGGSTAFTAGETVTGATSGATGIVLATGVATSGVYDGSAAGYVGLGAVTGTFQDGEDLQVGGVTYAVADGTQQSLTSPDDDTAKAWQAQATANARALIAAVPGSGSVRGIWCYSGDWYAFRDNAGGTAGVMHKATAAGWVEVALGYTLDFTSGGTYDLAEGDTITGATSGATATVARIVTQSGSWSDGDAAGYIVLTSATGTFQAENLDVGANANVATIAADKAAITLPAGGRYLFLNYNFSGSSLRMYGVNGVGNAFEFDGTVFTPIQTGMDTDTPHRIAEHYNHLFLAFPGGQLQNSSIGSPLDWSAVTGAGAFALGDEITDLVPNNASVLTILAKNKIANLYGTSVDDFQLQTLSEDAGAHPYTVAVVGQPIYMDNAGIRALSTTQAYGDFNIGTLSQKIKPLLQDYARGGVTPVAAVAVHNKDHYRIFFSNNAGLTFYLGGKEASVLPFDLGKLVTCIASSDTDDGERIMFGSDDGFVYEMEKGYSFDGGVIDASLRLPFNHQGAPQTKKRWHKVVVECQAIPTATISVAADFDYGSPVEVGAAAQDAVAQVFTVTGGGGIWDISNWNQFYWSGATEGLMEAWLDGVGRNMSLLIASSSADEPPHLLQGLTLFFTVRGLER